MRVAPIPFPRMADESCVGNFVRYDCGPLAGRIVRCVRPALIYVSDSAPNEFL